MPASQPASFNLQEFTDVGQLLVGGRLYTYIYGTTAQKIAFTDPDGTVPHTYTPDGAGGQYIALNARGELPTPLYLGSGSYDIALKRADGSTVWTRKADGVDNLPRANAESMAGPDGAKGVGYGADKLAGALDTLRLPSYVSLRDYAGPQTAAYISGFLATKAPSGIAGNFVVDGKDTTSADNGGTIIVDAAGRRWKRQFCGPAYVEWFGAKGDGVSDDTLAIQAAINAAMVVNGAIGFGPRNYLVTAQLLVTGSFRSVHLQGSRTGNHQTASSAGTCLVSSAVGNSTVIRAEFLTFANENISIDGINFYNPTLSKVNGGYPIKIVRGAANGRYISGFRFSNIGVMGFGAGIGFQGLNTANADNNFIGNVFLENFSVQGCGIGMQLANCSLNLVTLSNTLFFDCPYGGIRCEPDGEVGPGTGKGSVFIGTLCNKTHMEGVGGMFRTCLTPVLDSLGHVIRSSLTLIDFSHEGCAGTLNPAVGDPYQLGVNTDIHVQGFVIDGLSYGEVLLPYLNSSARIWCDSKMQVVCNGGKIMTPRGVNAPVLRETIANGAAKTINVPLAEATGFALKSHLVLSNGQGGYIESQHWGVYGGFKNTLSTGAAGAGITVTWNAAADANAISVTIANASGFEYSAELQVENLSSASINVASSV